MNYYIKLSKDGSFEPMSGVYEISEKFHTEIVNGVEDQIKRGKARAV